MTVATPSRSLDQRRAALTTANEVRIARAVLRRDLTGARAIEVILNPPGYTATMYVRDLLRFVPRVGRVKTSLILRLARIAENKRIGGMTERQRFALVAVLHEKDWA